MIVYLVGCDFVVSRNHFKHTELNVLNGAFGRVVASDEVLRGVIESKH